MSTQAEVRGVTVQGEEPKQLVLSDGSRLALAADDDRGVSWRRAETGNGGNAEVSVPEALHLAGDEYRGYVAVRTRAEAAWLRNIAEWYGSEADRLDRELAGQRAD